MGETVIESCNIVFFMLLTLANMSVCTNCRVLPYGCVATGLNTGFIEVVRKADTIERIYEKYRTSHSTRDRKVHVLYQWLKDHNPTEKRYICHMGISVSCQCANH